MSSTARPGVCIIVENQTVPFDRRVWLEARALQQAGYQVSVIAPKSLQYQSSRETLEGIEIYRHRSWSARGRIGYLLEYTMALLSEMYLAFKAYRLSPFQVLQACNPPDTIFLVALLFKPLGVRFVFDHHDLSPELFQVKFSGRAFNYRILRFLERMTFRTADLCIATNDSYRQIAIERGGVDPERTAVVQTCALLHEVNAVQPVPDLKRGRRHLVVYVGFMEVQDGVASLIASIEYLVKRQGRTDSHFVLLGAGSQVPFLKSMVKDSHLEEFVEFTGLVPRETVGIYLSTADVCVAPDALNPLNDNCTMVKNLEYMAFGKPVVLFDLKQGRATLGDSAFYATPGDPIDFAQKIATLLDSESLRKSMGDLARQRVVEELNWDVQRAIYVNAFATLLNHNSHR